MFCELVFEEMPMSYAVLKSKIEIIILNYQSDIKQSFNGEDYENITKYIIIKISFIYHHL
jgi:hypothetical protein